MKAGLTLGSNEQRVHRVFGRCVDTIIFPSRHNHKLFFGFCIWKDIKTSPYYFKRIQGDYSVTRSGTSITMDREILHWIDEKVKERIFASRSHAFEYAIRYLMKHGSQTLEY
ncbi:hypothetical protein ES703_111064 [subsurface metagenome]